MRDATVFLIGRLLVAFAAVLGAIYLAANGQDGWGWSLFIAFCALPSYAKG